MSDLTDEELIATRKLHGLDDDLFKEEKMNREIKFRIWDVENKEMLKVQELDFEPTFYGGRVAIRPEQYSDYFDTEDMILMQYTGLHDKNGKEIYEGDILKISDVDDAIVEWSNKYASFILKPIGDYYFDNEVLGCATEHNSLIKVIGNIYKNPELLEGE